MKLRTPPPDWSSRLDTAWAHAKAFFRKRSPVVFFSNGRFWEKQGFVQRSLAYELAREGIEVVWIDGADWRPYEPHVPDRPASLRVTKLRKLPLRRFGAMNRLSLNLEAQGVKAFLARGPEPFFWVWGAMDEELAARLPPVDVYSVFDNPYANLPDGGLCRNAKAIVCQNEFAENLFATRAREKTRRLLPPVSIPANLPHHRPELPKTFPKRVLGYVGTFLGEGFDFDLVEETLVQFPDWGVLLVGRSNEFSDVRIEKLAKFPNFHRVPWQPREKALAYWNVIDVAYFPYAEMMGQDGAFAVKGLEASFYAKPIVSTEVPKTQDLSDLLTFAESAEELRPLLDKWETLKVMNDDEFWDLAWDMHPRVHLARIAGF